MAIVLGSVSPFVIFFSLVLGLTGDGCSSNPSCVQYERWVRALVIIALALPIAALVGGVGAHTARSTKGRVRWTVATVAVPIAWGVVLVGALAHDPE